MTDSWQQGITTLLANTNIGFLATQGDKSPESSMAPYATSKGYILLHLSSLAKHTKNIGQNPNVGFMICTPETKGNIPLALARLSFTGTLEVVPEQERPGYQETYIKHIPDSEDLFSFPDFTLYRLNVESLFWVGGFGKARKLTKEAWASLC